MTHTTNMNHQSKAGIIEDEIIETTAADETIIEAEATTEEEAATTTTDAEDKTMIDMIDIDNEADLHDETDEIIKGNQLLH